MGRVGPWAIVGAVTAALAAPVILTGGGTRTGPDLPGVVTTVTREVLAVLRIGQTLDWALLIGVSLLFVVGWLTTVDQRDRPSGDRRAERRH